MKIHWFVWYWCCHSILALSNNNRSSLTKRRDAVKSLVFGAMSSAFQIVPDSSAQEADGQDAEIEQAMPMESSNASVKKNGDECNEACLQERKRIVQERRAMMNQSRTNTKRSDLFELSRQRATLYGTNYKGASCPPGVIPCL